MGLIYKWSQLDNATTFDDDVLDLGVGCTLDLFTKEPEQCMLIFKSPCYKSFTLIADLSETTQQLMGRIEVQENLLVADQILMNLNGASPGKLEPEATLAEQGIVNESILTLDIEAEAQYFLKVQVSADETIDLQYHFNATIEKIKQKLLEAIQVPVAQ